MTVTRVLVVIGFFLLMVAFAGAQIPSPGYPGFSRGTFVANSGTPVTVTNASVTAGSVVVFGLKTVGGTPAAPFMVTVTPGTGFTVNSGGADTSTYNFMIIG